MTAKIGTVDILPYIEDGTYKMDANKEYYEWKDGNEDNHREYTVSKVHGEMTVICDEKNGISLSALLGYISNASSDNKVTLTLYITNEDQDATIEAYLTLTTAFYREHKDGKTVHLINIKVDEV